jgi:hypothetical protein
MNANTLVAVSAYAGDLPQVQALAPCYLHHRCPVVVMSPVDAPITHEQVPWAASVVHAGKKEWAGPDSLIRHGLFLRELLRQPYDFYLFNDSDSVCLSPKIPSYLYEKHRTHFSNEVLDTNPGHSLLPKIAVQPGYFFSRWVLQKLVSVLERPAVSYTAPGAHENLPVPTSCIDHFQLQLIYAAGLDHQNYLDGASFETVSRHGLETMAHHVRDLKKNFVHSVKSAAVLDRLLAEYKNRK